MDHIALSKASQAETVFNYHCEVGIVNPLGRDLVQDILTANNLPPLPPDWEWRWMSARGAFSKRVASFYYKSGFRVEDWVIERIGSTAKRHTESVGAYKFDFTSRFDWDDGDFGDEGSCYWGKNSGARQMLRENGAFAIRFYSPIGRGIARAWLVPVMEDAYIIYNGYGPWEVNTLVIASMFARFCNWQYRVVGLANNGSTSGLLWINGTEGYLITPQASDLEFYDFGWENSRTCYGCGCNLDDDEYYDGLDNHEYCGSCFYEQYDLCSRCGDTIWSDDIHVVDGSEIWCEHCAEHHSEFCEECHQLVTTGLNRIKGRVVCDSCL